MSEAVLLTHDDTLELIKKAQAGDMQAREKLVASNIALVKSLVRRYINRGVEYDDLLQIGSLGLVKAVLGFKAEYGSRFSTYAVPLILGELKRYMRDDGMLKVSRSVKENYIKIKNAREQLCRELGCEPGVKDIAICLDISEDDVLTALESARAPISLEQPISDNSDSAPILEHIPGKEPEVGIIDMMLLKQYLGELEGNERKVILLRYFKSLTQSRIAEMLGISQVQVSRIESRVLKKLRIKMDGGAP